jgi:hypothetical protein
MKMTITYSGMTRIVEVRSDKSTCTLDIANEEGKNIGVYMSHADARIIATALREASKGK